MPKQRQGGDREATGWQQESDVAESTRTNQSDSNFKQDNDDDAYRDLPDSYTDDNEDNSYATQS